MRQPTLDLQLNRPAAEVSAHVLELIGASRAGADIIEIEQIELDPTIQRYVDRYEQIGNRPSFLWKWAWHGLEATTLSSVEEEWWQHVMITKELGIMFTVLIDDVADSLQDASLLDKLLRALLDRTNREIERLTLTTNRPLFDLVVDLWIAIWGRASALPLFGELRDLLDFDYHQILNCMRYSLLANRDPRRINPTEHRLYLPHNMHIMVHGTIDLMASPELDLLELGKVREALVHAQQMGRIGNSISTWERELRDADYSSDIFPLAFDRGVVSPSELGDLEMADLEARLRPLEDDLLMSWATSRQELIQYVPRVQTVDIGALVNGLGDFLRYHLGSRGRK